MHGPSKATPFFSLLCNCSLTLVVASNSMKESGNYVVLVARLKSIFSTCNLIIGNKQQTWLNIRKLSYIFSLGS